MSLSEIAVAITPIVTGSLSLVASSTIIVKIIGFEVKLQSPYSRLIFGLSAYDVISSSCNVASTMVFPVDTPDVWGAIGNDTTCSIQGVLFSFSTVVTPFYNCALCIYYLCVLKYSMPDEKFSKHVEPALHGIALVFSASTSFYLLAKDIIHTTETMCWITSASGDIEDVRTLRWIISGFPLLFIFAAIIVIMLMITLSVWKEEKGMDQYMMGHADLRFRRNDARNRTKVKAVQKQANCYFAGFLFTYGPAFVYRVLEGAMDQVPLFFILLSRFTHPLQGIFNLIAHMQPQVTSLRRSRPSLSWTAAFITAIKNYDSNLDRVTINVRALRHGSNSPMSHNDGTFMNRVGPDDGQDHQAAITDTDHMTDAAILVETGRFPIRQMELKKSVEEKASSICLQISEDENDEESDDCNSTSCIGAKNMYM